MTTAAEADILKIIKNTPGVTFNELVQISLWNPQTIDRVLRLLQKQGKIERVHLKNKKAKGFRILQV